MKRVEAGLSTAGLMRKLSAGGKMGREAQVRVMKWEWKGLVSRKKASGERVHIILKRPEKMEYVFRDGKIIFAIQI